MSRETKGLILVGAVLFLLVVAKSTGADDAIPIALAGLLIYFVPSIMAQGKRNFKAVLILNLLLGWTVIGWIVALIWANVNDPKPMVVLQQSLNASVLCSACGKYAAAGSQFCPTCGRSLGTMTTMGGILAPRIEEFPLFFPVCRELPPETG